MTTKHTCNGPVFGRKTAGCPRCDELIAGAKPVVWSVQSKRLEAQQLLREIREHSCTASRCGPVCTAFQW